MCLIITGNSRQIRKTLLTTPSLTDSIYDYNADGIGFMFATESGALRTRKFLPNDLKDFEDAIRRLPNDNRTIAIHARYKTHGTINMDNVHPYPVVDGRIAMMHNGVLSHGNAADPAKSDTWHYIERHVKPLMSVYPDAYKNEGVISIIENDIGTGNRFVFMNDQGELEIYNKHTGIEHEGMWFSNTYAWEPWLLIPTYKKPAPRSVYTGYKPGNLWGAPGIKTHAPSVNGKRIIVDTNGLADYPDDSWDDSQDEGFDPNVVLSAEEVDEIFVGDVYDAWYDGDDEMLALLLQERPNFALRTILEGETFTSLVDEVEEPGVHTRELADLLEQEDIVELTKRCYEDDLHAELASTIIWHGTWTAKQETEANDTFSEGMAEAMAEMELYERQQSMAFAARITA